MLAPNGCDSQHIHMIIQKLGRFFFRARSYVPIPFLLTCTIFGDVGTSSLMTGLTFVVLGEVLRLWAVGYLGLSSRKTKSARADSFEDRGPYSISRNPIYIGNMSIYLGFVLLSNIFFPYFAGLTVIFFGFVYYAIIRYEEISLADQFGEAYKNFLVRVPRFIGYRDGPSAQSRNHFNLRTAFVSERTTFTAIGFSLVIIIVSDIWRHR